MRNILYLGQEPADMLKESVRSHVQRYMSGDFLDYEAKGNWSIRLTLTADIDALSALSPAEGVDAEVANSIIVGRSFSGLTPSLAREDRIWTRLSHIECLDFCRARWIRGQTDEDKVVSMVELHFFASTLTSCRDDHAVSRLWWNHHIASKIFPESVELGLRAMLGKADIRQGFVERSGLAARPRVARAIVELLIEDQSLATNMLHFKRFMRTLNLRGAGLVFEAMRDEQIRSFMRQVRDQCADGAPIQAV